MTPGAVVRETLWAAPLLAFLGTLALGPAAIPVLRRLGLGQPVREHGPARHQAKAGTPTMGGVIFLIPLAVAVLAAGRWPAAVAALGAAAGFGFLGFLDDALKVAARRPGGLAAARWLAGGSGLRARWKLLGQVAVGLGLAAAALELGRGTVVAIPFGGGAWDLGPLYAPFATLVVIATANAVNLTDGLDGLAAGTALVAFVAVGVVALVRGPGGAEVFAFAAAAALAGFLPYNRHPARVWMGDTGSMALGAGLAAVAVLSGAELVLPMLGGVFVAEALSVIIQVLSFRLTGRRVLLMSPLHHHFELRGLSESQIVRRFWAWSAAFAALGLVGARTLK